MDGQSKNTPHTDASVVERRRHKRFFEEVRVRFRDIEGVEIHVLDRKDMADRPGRSTHHLVGLIARLKPAAVIVCNPTQFLFALLARIRHRFKIGLFLEDSPLSESRKHRTIRVLRKLVYRRADFCFFYSNDAREYAEQIGMKSRFYRTSWSIDPAWLENRHTAGNTEKLRFLFVGALNTMKGVMDLLGAWNDFAANRQDVELVLVGEGPLRDSAIEYCKAHSLDSVTLTGQLPYEDIREQYGSADVFVLPTHQDLFSLVVTEAMSFRLPVLTTIYNGARELVRDGWNGYIFDPHDRASVLDALNSAADAREELPQMGRRSYEVIQDYTHQKVIARMRKDLETELAPGDEKRIKRLLGN